MSPKTKDDSTFCKDVKRPSNLEAQPNVLQLKVNSSLPKIGKVVYESDMGTCRYEEIRA